MTLSLIIDSKIFHGNHVKDTGFDPFLKIGGMLSHFQSGGTGQVSIDLLKNFDFRHLSPFLFPEVPGFNEFRQHL